MKAFPIPTAETSRGYNRSESGMDLRDYFAAKALQAIIAWGAGTEEDVVVEAYLIADMMMKARELKHD